MPSIRKNLLQFIFSGSYMKRWNDKLRPTELTEVDKQAHKMLTAWLLCLRNQDGMSDAERLALETAVVEGGIFDYLYRLVVTDIKPPVFYRIKENPEHYRQLSDWVTKELEPRLKPVDEDLWERFLAYVHTTEKNTLADRILDAAHHYASYWEFRLFSSLNWFDEELPGIEESFRVRLKGHADIRGVSELLDEDPSSAFRNFATLCGQLRFQKRWSQTPRIPETSVLGHMFLVACYAFFFSLGVGACPARRMNNFFAGLLHDLPEVLTRDIIFPVKKSISGLDDLIRDYEEGEVSRRILTPLQNQGFATIVDRLRYFLGLDIGSEFYESVRVDGETRRSDFDALQTLYNENRFDPKDGTLLKTCDSLAAFIEAYTAVRNGIASDQLQQAIWRLREDNRHKEFGPVHVGALFADFD